MEDRQFSIETPVGSISSDSGNHFTDVATVLGVIVKEPVKPVVFTATVPRFNEVTSPVDPPSIVITPPAEVICTVPVPIKLTISV